MKVQKSTNNLISVALILICLLSILINFTACYLPTEQEQSDNVTEDISLGFEKVKVSWVVDGDTIKTEDDRTIRIIGINAPENGEYKEKFGKESTRYAIDTLKNKDVFLEKDESELDQYGRELRYVWLQIPDEINEENILKYNYSVLSISQGFTVPYIFEPDRKYEEYIIQYAIDARENGIGLWQYGYKGTTRMTKF